MSAAEEINEEETLINQIHEEIRKIRDLKRLMQNNVERVEVCGPLHKAILESDFMKVVLENEKLTGCSLTKLNPIEDLIRDMKTEIDAMGRDIFKLVQKEKEFEDFCASLSKNIENLKLMQQASNNAEDSSKGLDVIEKNIKQRFLKEKRELKTVITTLFPDNLDIQDVIAKLTEFHFTEGGDKYMTLEESDTTAEQIEALLRMEIAEKNPNNPREIKLANLL